MKLLLVALFQLLLSTTVHSQTIEQIPNRTELTLGPNEWMVTSVLICNESVIDFVLDPAVKLYNNSGTSEKRRHEADIDALLDYHQTKEAGYSIHIWQTNSSENGPFCQEVITRLYNNPSLDLSSIEIQVAVKQNGIDLSDVPYFFNVTFITEDSIATDDVTTEDVTTDIVKTENSDITTRDCVQPSIGAGVQNPSTSAAIGVVAGMIVGVLLTAIPLLVACMLLTRRRGAANNRNDVENGIQNDLQQIKLL